MKSFKFLAILGLALVGQVPASYADVATALQPVASAARTALSTAAGVELSATAATALVNSAQGAALAQSLGVTLAGSSTVRAEQLAKALANATPEALVNIKAGIAIVAETYSKKVDLNVASVNATLDAALKAKGVSFASSDVAGTAKASAAPAQREDYYANLQTKIAALQASTDVERVLSAAGITEAVKNLEYMVGTGIFSHLGLDNCLNTFGPVAKANFMRLVLAAGDIGEEYQKNGKNLVAAIKDGTRNYFQAVHGQTLADMKITTAAEFDAWLDDVALASTGNEACVYERTVAASLVK